MVCLMLILTMEQHKNKSLCRFEDNKNLPDIYKTYFKKKRGVENKKSIFKFIIKILEYG